jgi:hypothetical protein
MYLMLSWVMENGTGANLITCDIGPDKIRNLSKENCDTPKIKSHIGWMNFEMDVKSHISFSLCEIWLCEFFF